MMILPTGNDPAFLFYFVFVLLPITWAYPLFYPEISQRHNQRSNNQFTSSNKPSNFRRHGYSDAQQTLHAEPRQYLDDEPELTGGVRQFGQTAPEVTHGVRQFGSMIPVFGRSNDQLFRPQVPSSAYQYQPQNPTVYGPGLLENTAFRGEARNYGVGGGEGGGSSYRKPLDLVIPSYAYVPERYTGAMQYLPNPTIFAAGTPGAYIRDWKTYIDQFREQDVPVTPAYDTIWENLVAYLDGHPVNESTTTVASIVALSQLTKLSGFGGSQIIGNLTKTTRFRPCVSRRSANRFGVCVDDSLVTQFCVGKSVAKSIICEKKQSCCLDLSSSDEPETSMNSLETSTNSPETSTNSPNRVADVAQFPTSVASLAAESGPFKPCGTRARGVMEFGICVPDELLGGLCRGKFVSHSDHCVGEQSCCSDGSLAPDGFRRRLATQRPETTTRPTTVSVTTERPVSARFQPCISGQKTPHGQFGICVDDSLLGQFCVDQFLSKSTNCESTQSCCIDAPTKTTPSFSPPTPPPNFDPPSQKIMETFTFRPNTVRRSLVFVKNSNIRRRNPVGVANPSIVRNSVLRSCTTSQSNAAGICVPDFSVADQCSGKALFRSTDCSNGQTCCVEVNPLMETSTVLPVFTTSITEPVSSSNSPKQTTFIPCVSSENHVSVGICVDNNLIASLCTERVVSQSQNCFARQSCCTEMQPSQDVNTENPSTTLQNVNFKSVEATSDSAGAAFTPCSTPRAVLQYGICVQDTLVSQLCGGQFISKSQDCTQMQTCCVGDTSNMVSVQARAGEIAAPSTTPIPTTMTTTMTTTIDSKSLIPSQFIWPQIFQQCIPIVDNFQLGVCVSESQVGTLCSGRLVAPSRSCGLAQSCCSYFPEASVPVVRMKTTTTTTTTTPTTPTPAMALVPADFSVDNAQNVLHRCAAGGSAVGVCVSEAAAMDYCQGKMISVSEDCSLMQLCCYES